MKITIKHSQILLIVTLFVIVAFLLNYWFSLYANYDTIASKYNNVFEAFTSMKDSDNNPINTNDKYLIYSVAHNKVLQVRENSPISSTDINISDPYPDDNMLFNIVDNVDGTEGIWNIGKSGFLGMNGNAGNTYLLQAEPKGALPSWRSWERFNIVNYGADNIVAIKSSAFNGKYYYLHSNGNVMVGNGGSWERMKFINYSKIEQKRTQKNDNAYRIAITSQNRDITQTNIDIKQSKIDALQTEINKLIV